MSHLVLLAGCLLAVSACSPAGKCNTGQHTCGWPSSTGGRAGTGAPPPADASSWEVPRGNLADASVPDASVPDASVPDASVLDAREVPDLASGPDGASVVDAGALADAGWLAGRPCDFDQTYRYSPIGGREIFGRRAYLTPGNHYRYVEEFPEGGVYTCSPPMPPCAQSYLLNPYFIAYLLVDPVVVAAFSSRTPVFFGYDERPFDGTALDIQSQTGEFMVGAECEGRTPCTPIPQVVRTLVGALHALDVQQLSLPVCVNAGVTL